ncbi:sigma factor [Microbacterium sp. X-17]|uniref:sigma factor n=1 Tax=Microbacterium sp. X-17 TaxID=3144404 RepID=UPI0031F4F6E3
MEADRPPAAAPDRGHDPRLEAFTEHRPTLLAAAFHITGSRADAEDVVQDAWEKWARVDLGEIDAPRAFLSVMVSRLALNAVRAQRRRRETYVGPWLPDPIVDDGSPEWAVLQAEGLGHALDIVLTALTPEQATAYVLRKVLDVAYADIAAVLECTPAAARQLVSRAQRAIGTLVDGTPAERRARDERALAALAAAVSTEDVDQIVALLDPASTLYSDGGGRAKAALRPVLGPERIARFLLGTVQREDSRFEVVVINGRPGVLAVVDGVVTTTLTLRVNDAGVIDRLYFVRNPEKLPA